VVAAYLYYNRLAFGENRKSDQNRNFLFFVKGIDVTDGYGILRT
jgi:hypothetical protein